MTQETFTFQLDKGKLKEAELRDGHDLLRTNWVAEEPAVLWDRYMQLTQQIEAAFKCFEQRSGHSSDLPSIGTSSRSAHSGSFLARCLTATRKPRLRYMLPD